VNGWDGFDLDVFRGGIKIGKQGDLFQGSG
jgi:hypothetical protein